MSRHTATDNIANKTGRDYYVVKSCVDRWFDHAVADGCTDQDAFENWIISEIL